MVFQSLGFGTLDMNKTTVCIALLGLAAARLAAAGEITGVITLKGTPPKELDITPLKDDPTCGKLHTDLPTTRFFVVGPKGQLADVVVSIDGISAKSTGASAPPAVLDQQGCLYVPQILAVQTDQKILVKNSDPVMHNVHDTPTVTGNEEKNMAQLPKGPDLTFSFPKPEEFVRFKCDVHAWMFAWISVFDHPYFAVSGKDGAFRIANVPPGKYTLKAIHRKAGTLTKAIEVKDGQPTTADFTLEIK
jgi:hypothetical protein